MSKLRHTLLPVIGLAVAMTTAWPHATMLPAAAQPAAAQPAAARPAAASPAIAQPTWLDQAGGAAGAIAVAAHYAYVGQGPRLDIFEATYPAHPHLAAESPILPGIVTDITVVGQTIFLGLDRGGLRIFGFNTTGDRVLRQVGTYAVTGTVSAVTIDRGNAYLLSKDDREGAGRLQVVDVRDLSAPKLVTSISLDAGTSGGDIVIANGWAYVAASVRQGGAEAGTGGLLVFDVHTPITTTQVSASPLPYPARSLAVARGTAFVGMADQGIRAFKLAKPAAPVEIAQVGLADPVVGLSVAGDVLFAAVDGTQKNDGSQGVNGLMAFDVSDAARLPDVGTLKLPGDAWALELDGDRAYLADGGGGLQIIDVGTPRAPKRLGFAGTSVVAERIAVAGPYAYASSARPDGDLDLGVVDIRDPHNLSVAAGIDVQDWVRCLYATPRYVFTCIGLDVGADNTIRAYEAGVVPPRLIEIEDDQTLKAAKDIAVAGDLAFIARPLNVQIADIHDIRKPRELGMLRRDGVAFYQVAADDHYAYAVDTTPELTVIDVHDPLNPKLVGTVGLPTTPQTYLVQELVVRNGYAYLVDGAGGLHIVDVRVPAQPRVVGLLNTPGNASGLAIAGHKAYIADGPGGVRVVDIGDPAAPHETAALEVPGGASGVVVAAGLMYVAAGNGGVFAGKVPDYQAELGLSRAYLPALFGQR